jgi:arginine/lysine/ornithine decarboxylase
MKQTRIPIYEQLIMHAEQKPVSFHVPGHKYGQLLTDNAKVSSYFTDLLRIDATELTGLDDLHSPEGVIREAENLLAQLYGVKRSYFLVNGSTVGNLAMIMTAVKENDLVLVQRNCHKSILNGIHLAKAEPIFLGPSVDEEWAVAGGVPYQTVEQAISKYPHAKAIILTYPNYYGMTNDIEKIIQLAHLHHIPVLIDEAHGAHFIGGEMFPPSAVELKADIVVQSAHKTLPAMTMGAYLHFNSDLLLEGDLTNYLQVLQSSSPSYPIMASLDIARNYLATYTKEDEAYLENKINEFRAKIQQIKGLKVLSYSGIQGDPLKITIQSNTSLRGFDIQKSLEKEGIYIEMADPFNILLVFPMLKAHMEYPIQDIVDRFRSVLENTPYSDKKNGKKVIGQPTEISQLALTAKERATLKTTLIPLNRACGQVCAEIIIPYPPGIPLLFPGEIISKDTIDRLMLLLDSGARFQGEGNLRNRKITIYQT